MFGISKSIGKKLGISIGLLFLLNLITVLAFFYIFNAQKAYGPAINESGRLRMLSQRASKNVFSISEGHNEAKEDLIVVSQDFDTTLGILISGSKDRGMVTPSDSINQQLLKVKGLWEGIHNNITIVVSATDKNKKFEDSVTYVRENNMALLKEANNAVTMYEKESSTKQNSLVFLISTVMSILGLIVLIVVVGIIRKITTSLSELTKATKTISRFSLASNIKVESEDEIGELAKNFNLMVENMKNSMEQVQEK
ncbi:MAG: type IV pili methyl-accepting chemotaxis transducer N-terminal domain-containing protein [Cyanobacteriota bacterium]